MNRAKVITLLIIWCMCTIASAAKDVKIKYTSTIEYIGEGKKKTPMGKGLFTIYSKENKKQPILTLSGTFESIEEQNSELRVKDAELSFADGLSFKSPILSVSISKEKNKESIRCQLPDCNIISNDHNIASANVDFLIQWLKTNGQEYTVSIATS